MPRLARWGPRRLALAALATMGVAALLVVAVRPRAVPVDTAVVRPGPMQVTVVFPVTT